MASAEVTHSWVLVASAIGVIDRVEPGREQVPDRRELEQAADDREQAERADRPEHRDRPLLAVMGVEVLAGERRRLAREDDEEEPECVDAGEERSGEACDVDDVAVPAVVERRRDDRVLREEAGEREDADERERADEEHPLRERHQLPDARELADVLLADDARGSRCLPRGRAAP